MASKLDGTEWILMSLYGQGLLDGINIPLNITGDGIEGSTGCDRCGSNSVTMNGGELKISRNLSTKVGCPAGIMQQESTYIRALAKATSYQVRDGRLEIQDSAGEAILVYTIKE